MSPDTGVIAKALTLMGWHHDTTTDEWAHPDHTFGALVMPRTAELVVGLVGFAAAFVAEAEKNAKVADDTKLIIERLWRKQPGDRRAIRDMFPEVAADLDLEIDWSNWGVDYVTEYGGCLYAKGMLLGIGKTILYLRSRPDALRMAKAHLATILEDKMKEIRPTAHEEVFFSYSTCGRFAITGMSRRGACVLHIFDNGPGNPPKHSCHKWLFGLERGMNDARNLLSVAVRAPVQHLFPSATARRDDWHCDEHPCREPHSTLVAFDEVGRVNLAQIEQDASPDDREAVASTSAVVDFGHAVRCFGVGVADVWVFAPSLQHLLAPLIQGRDSVLEGLLVLRRDVLQPLVNSGLSGRSVGCVPYVEERFLAVVGLLQVRVVRQNPVQRKSLLHREVRWALEQGSTALEGDLLPSLALLAFGDTDRVQSTRSATNDVEDVSDCGYASANEATP